MKGRRIPVTRPGTKTAAFKQALPLCVPIMAGFVFLGITCGVYSSSLGLPWWMPTLMSIAIFGGSAEFVVASMLPGAFDPLTAFLVVLVVQARHLFYGLSMLGPFRGMGKKKPYLIYAMCDESFSINYSAHAPASIDRGWFMTFVSLLNQGSWVVGCTLGGVFGSMIPLHVQGISFAMTALFVVIFMDQWLSEPSHASSLTGLAATALALVVFGPDSFLIPAMVLILIVVTAARAKLEPVYGDAGEKKEGERA
ncbi:AzlC family ABC transporter permease [Collinsella tanakaei]|nr:AzlC family ABC transporter permease [Collinsella tanakaei]